MFRLDALFGPKVLPYLLMVAFLGAGGMVGVVVATGNLVLIALVIGGLCGLLLLNALPVAVWLLLIGVFLVNGPVGYFSPALSKISWLFSLLGVFMSGAAVLYAAVGRQRPARPIPRFVFYGIGFVLLAVIGIAFSNGSMAEISAGAKRQFHFIGVMFLLAVVPFTDRQVRGWMMFLLGAAVVQLPLALYQRVVLVPQVTGFDMPGFVPFDIIVGTFEGSIYGGGASAIMAMFQVLAIVGLFCAWRERLIGAGLFGGLLLLTVLPLGLGETKVVLILIPVVLAFAFYDTVARRPLAFLGGALATVVVGAVLGYFYFLVQVSGEMSLAENLSDTFAYNFGQRGYYGTGVNRLTAVPYWFEQQSWAQPLRALFGWGLGSSYGADGRVPLAGHLFVAHAGQFIDLLATSLILWDFGLVGALLFFGMMVSGGFTARRNLNEAQTAWDRTLCRILLGSLGASLLMSAYSASIIVLVSHSFILSLTLGLIAWRARRGPMAESAADAARSLRQGPLGGAGAGRSRRGKGGGGLFPTDGLLPPTALVGAGAVPALQGRPAGRSHAAGPSDPDAGFAAGDSRPIRSGDGRRQEWRPTTGSPATDGPMPFGTRASTGYDLPLDGALPVRRRPRPDDGTPGPDRPAVPPAPIDVPPTVRPAAAVSPASIRSGADSAALQDPPTGPMYASDDAIPAVPQSPPTSARRRGRDAQRIEPVIRGFDPD